jgi:hypothetical protein
VHHYFNNLDQFYKQLFGSLNLGFKYLRDL